jgi:hypothetical protein
MGQVESKVNYLDFGSLINQVLKEGNERLPNCRDILLNCINMRKPDSAMNPEAKGLKVLLIDEVDVFFGDSFYGQGFRYAPFSCMEDIGSSGMVHSCFEV